MADILIREYKAMELPTVVSLLRLNTPMYFALDEEKDLLFYLQNEIEHYYVLAYDHTIVGSGGINFSEDKMMGKISWDIFHPAFQGRGLGGMLLNFRINKLKELNHIKTISVRTSQLVYQFYEKHGFQLREIVKDYWAEGLDMYRLEYIDL